MRPSLRCSTRIRKAPACKVSPKHRIPIAKRTSLSARDVIGAVARRITETPSVTPMAAPALDDITRTKKARVMFGRKSNAPNIEPRRNCMTASIPLSTTYDMEYGTSANATAMRGGGARPMLKVADGERCPTRNGIEQEKHDDKGGSRSHDSDQSAHDHLKEAA